MKKNAVQTYILWGITLLIAGGITWFSTQNGTDSGGLSGDITTALLQLFPNFRAMGAPEQLLVYDLVQALLRSAAHCTIFLCLGVFAALLAKQYPLRYPLLISLAACVLYGVWDELYQGMLAQGRACQLIDMVKDSAGAAVGTGLVWLFTQKTKHREGADEASTV